MPDVLQVFHVNPMGLNQESFKTSESIEHSPTIAVGAIIFELNRREAQGAEPSVLLIRRGKAPSAGRYSLPGGRVQRGETLHDALIREIFEETGLRIRVGPLIEIVELIEPAFHYVILDYLGVYAEGAPTPGDDALEAHFVPLSELDRYAVSDAVKHAIAKARAMNSPL